MKVTVKLTAAFAQLTLKKSISCELVENADLFSLIDCLDAEFPSIKQRLCHDDSRILDSINIYVNGDNVRHSEGLKTILKNADIINIIPAVAAG